MCVVLLEYGGLTMDCIMKDSWLSLSRLLTIAKWDQDWHYFKHFYLVKDPILMIFHQVLEVWAKGKLVLLLSQAENEENLKVSFSSFKTLCPLGNCLKEPQIAPYTKEHSVWCLPPLQAQILCLNGLTIAINDSRNTNQILQTQSRASW